jgi:hypothetical protein
MTNVTGFLVRANLSDTGTLPRGGGWTGCPDIIPAGLTAIAKEDLIKSYGSITDKALTQGLTNYLYLRAKNMNTTKLTQQAYMFQVPGSLVLHPEQWYSVTNLVGYDKKNDNFDRDNPVSPDNQKIIKKYAQTLTAEAAQIAVTDAYTWKPETTEHHCLVGVVANTWQDVLAGFPQGVSSTDDLARWIWNNGSFGWHNVNIQPLTSRVYEGNIAYAHAKQVDEFITFSIVAENVPVGAKVSFSSNTATKLGKVIGQDWVTVSAPPEGGSINPRFEIAASLTIEAGYKAVITYRTDFAGTAAPANFNMSMKAVVVTQADAPKNTMAMGFHAANNLSRSYSRALSPNAIFRTPSGETLGRGLAGYRKMLATAPGRTPHTSRTGRAAAFSPGDDGGDLEDLMAVLVGSHTTTPVHS